MRLRINDSQILWPGKQKKKPEGIIIPTHLKVLTIEEKPFVYVRKIAEDDPSNECEADEIPCPLFNATDGLGMKYFRKQQIYSFEKYFLHHTIVYNICLT